MQVISDRYSRRRHLFQTVLALAGLAAGLFYFLLASVGPHAGVWILVLPTGGLLTLSVLTLIRSVRSLFTKGVGE